MSAVEAEQLATFALLMTLMAQQEGKEDWQTKRLDKASTACGMEIRAEKTKLMTNNTSRINTGIK